MPGDARQPLPPARPTRPLRIDYARPGLRPWHLSDLRVTFLTAIVTLWVFAAMGAALFILVSLFRGILSLTGGR